MPKDKKKASTGGKAGGKKKQEDKKRPVLVAATVEVLPAGARGEQGPAGLRGEPGVGIRYEGSPDRSAECHLLVAGDGTLRYVMNGKTFTVQMAPMGA